MNALAHFHDLPFHLVAIQALVNRCSNAADRKGLIVAAAVHGALAAEEAELLIQANQLETA